MHTKTHIWFGIIAILVLLIGCHKEQNRYVHDVKTIELFSKNTTKEADLFVSINDAWRFVENHQSAATKGGDAISILPVIDKMLDTLLYIVNYEEGWSVLSSDRRVPAIIASSPTGNISLEESNHAFLSWLNSTAIDIKRVRESHDSELKFSNKEINMHKRAWESSFGDRIVPIEPPTPGDSIKASWVLDSIYFYYETYDVKSHCMVPEHWAQEYPYNVYCPLDNNGNNYYVGCAGVAAGALLHYLYRKNNTPTSFNGIPMDSVAVNYSSILSDSTRVTARYLRAVNDAMGLTTLINYWQGGTFAFPSQVSSLFSNYGYSCTYELFDAETVELNIVSHNPVLVVAFDEWILNLPDITEGHYFIIDGYELKRPVTARHYVFVDNGHVRPEYGEHVEYTYGTPFVANITMNWGWSSQWTSNANNGWYSLTGSWTTNNGTYDTDRHIFYNFQ